MSASISRQIVVSVAYRKRLGNSINCNLCLGNLAILEKSQWKLARMLAMLELVMSVIQFKGRAHAHYNEDTCDV